MASEGRLVGTAPSAVAGQAVAINPGRPGTLAPPAGSGLSTNFLRPAVPSPFRPNRAVPTPRLQSSAACRGMRWLSSTFSPAARNAAHCPGRSERTSFDATSHAQVDPLVRPRTARVPRSGRTSGARLRRTAVRMAAPSRSGSRRSSGGTDRWLSFPRGRPSAPASRAGSPTSAPLRLSDPRCSDI
jgi:hypothetical protein